jgi:hypothetical protein
MPPQTLSGGFDRRSYDNGGLFGTMSSAGNGQGLFWPAFLANPSRLNGADTQRTVPRSREVPSTAGTVIYNHFGINYFQMDLFFGFAVRKSFEL